MAAVGGTAKRTFDHLRKHDRNDRNEEFENWKHRWVPSAKWRFPHREPSWTVLLQEPEDGQRRRRAEAQSLLISWINVAWIFRSSTKLIQLFTSIYQGKRNTRFDPKWAHCKKHGKYENSEWVRILWWSFCAHQLSSLLAGGGKCKTFVDLHCLDCWVVFSSTESHRFQQFFWRLERIQEESGSPSSPKDWAWTCTHYFCRVVLIPLEKDTRLFALLKPRRFFL